MPRLIKTLICLGSSSADGPEILRKSLMDIGNHFFIVRGSDIVKTDAFGIPVIDFFYNQLLICDTPIAPFHVMKTLQAIERKYNAKRRKDRFWGERNLDCDILYMGKMVLVSSRLVIPHDGIGSRKYLQSLIAQIGWFHEKL